MKFDRRMLACCAWLVAGLFIDGWAHFHLVSATESFFTPWHALLYSGFLACATLLVWAMATNPDRTLPFVRRAPQGYGASVLGLGIFAVGGCFDMLWHVFMGIEKDIATQLSPSHLMLAAGLVLIVGGPFCAAAARVAKADAPTTIATQWPAIVSAGLVLGIVMLFTKALQPTYIPLESIDWHLAANLPQPLFGDIEYLEQALGVACFVVQSTIVMSFFLCALRRGLLPPGACTLMLSLATLLFEVDFLPVAISVGILADCLILRWPRLSSQGNAVRWFSFIVPAALCAGFHVEVLLTRGGIWWQPHLVAGSILLSGLVGVVLSYLVFDSTRMAPEPQRARAPVPTRASTAPALAVPLLGHAPLAGSFATEFTDPGNGG